MSSDEPPEDEVAKQRGKRGIATIVIGSGDVQVVRTAKINAPRRNPAAGRARLLAWLKSRSHFDIRKAEPNMADEKPESVPEKGFFLGTPSAELGSPEEGGLGGPTGPEITDEKGDVIESEDGKPITADGPPPKDADKS